MCVPLCQVIIFRWIASDNKLTRLWSQLQFKSQLLSQNVVSCQWLSVCGVIWQREARINCIWTTLTQFTHQLIALQTTASARSANAPSVSSATVVVAAAQCHGQRRFWSLTANWKQADLFFCNSIYKISLFYGFWWSHWNILATNWAWNCEIGRDNPKDSSMHVKNV